MSERSSTFSRFTRPTQSSGDVKPSIMRRGLKPLCLPQLCAVRERAAKESEALKTALAHRLISSPVLVTGTGAMAVADSRIWGPSGIIKTKDRVDQERPRSIEAIAAPLKVATSWLAKGMNNKK